MIEFTRPKKSGLSLDMTPMIDIVFQLLIFFMLSSSFVTPALRLTLPKAVLNDKPEAEQIVVSVDKQGDVFINTVKSSMTELKSVLEEKLARDSKKSVHIRGDQDMPYKFFVEVMDTARQAGAKQVNIVHESIK